MKISDTNQQINRKPELSKTDSADNLAGIKRAEQKSKNHGTVTESAAIKTDTVQLSRESRALANAEKAQSGDKAVTEETIINENTLVELLKKADKQSGIFGSSEGKFRAIEQGNTDDNSGGKLNFLL